MTALQSRLKLQLLGALLILASVCWNSRLVCNTGSVLVSPLPTVLDDVTTTATLRRDSSAARQSSPLPLLPPPLSLPLSPPLQPKWSFKSDVANDSCLYVEDICHSSHRWFYRTHPQKHQPVISLKMNFEDFDNMATPYKTRYEFQHIFPNSSFPKWDQCIDSPVTNHVVLFTVFGDMLGEFYTRGALFLWRLSQQVDWLKPAQLYLHAFSPFKSLLDSHHLFTSPFRSRPLMDFRVLLDETSCTCMPRLILCGYQQNATRTLSTVASRDNATGTTLSMNVIALEPGGPLLPERNDDDHSYHEFREYLRDSLIDDNPLLQHDIMLYRQQILKAHQGVVDSVQIDDNYLIVGLSQRKGRRKWLDLDQVMEQVQSRLDRNQHRMVLVEMNVEDQTSSAYQQIVRHGAMDALIGIHGAQLTEAIWMKPQSWVVELLPYIPDFISMGEWTKTTDRPTPLGIIFDETNLNHVGYPLPRHSAPYCYQEEAKQDQEAIVHCWGRDGNPWDDRNFRLDAEALETILLSYLRRSQTFEFCDDFVREAGDALVLYNVNCIEKAQWGAATTEAVTNASLLMPHHYFRAP